MVCYGLQGVFNVVIIQAGHDGVNLDVREADMVQLRKDLQAMGTKSVEGCGACSEYSEVAFA